MLQPTQNLLELNDVRVKYPLKHGLFNQVKSYKIAAESIQLSLSQGEALGIVGESGSGKSSLALAIARLIISEGQIHFQAQDLNLLTQNEFDLH